MKILEKIGQFIAEKMKSVYDVINNHKKDTNNPHKVTKGDVGLGDVDNTSDAEKPMSKATIAAIGNISKDLTDLENHVDLEISHIKNGETIVGKSEYAQKLGTEQDSFTKLQIEHALNALLSDASLDPETFILTFRYYDGTEKIFDLPIEATVKDGRYDDETKELVLVLVSGQEIRIPASGLVKVYIGKESTTTTVSIDERTGGITVDVKEGAITKEHLSEELQTELGKLENLPENANETFASKDSEPNIFKLDFTEVYDTDDLSGAVKNDIINSLNGVTAEELMNKLSYFSIKKDNVNLLIPIKFEQNISSMVILVADTNKPIDMESEDDYISFKSLRINLRYKASNPSSPLVTLSESPVSVDTKDFNLTAQLNESLPFGTTPGFGLGSADSSNYSKQNACNTFDELAAYIKNDDIRVMPSINFKTPTSKSLYPAIVETPSGSPKEINSISIKYIKEIDGVKKLITETLDFSANGGLSNSIKEGATTTYSKYAEDVYNSPCLIHVDAGEEEGTYTVNTEEVEAYYQKVSEGKINASNALFLYDGINLAISSSKIEDNKLSVQTNTWNDLESLSYFSIEIEESLDSGISCSVNKFEVKGGASSNINVVEEYPTDLSTYPDGSIFIKIA